MRSEYKYLHSNSRDNQIKILEDNTSPAIKPNIEEAFDHVVGKGKKIVKVDNVNNIVEKIFAIADGSSEKKDLENIFFNLPESIIVSSESIKEILPQIIKIRQELFSKKEPPFPNIPDKAFKWLKNEAHKEALPILQKIEMNKEKSNELLEEILNKMGEYAKLTHVSCGLSQEYPSLSTLRHSIQVWEGTPLGKLKEKIERLSKKTNLTQESLIMYLFTGIRPLSLIYDVEVKWMPRRKIVNLNIYRSLKKKEIEVLYRKIKKEFEMEGRALIFNKKLSFLYESMESEGGTPPKNKREFWERIAKKCNKKFPGWFKGDNCANNARITYYRLMKRIRRS